MSDLVLAAAGVLIFMLTTWATLVFGYQVFQNRFEADSAVPARAPGDGVPVPVGAVDATGGEASRPSELVQPAAPSA